MVAFVYKIGKTNVYATSMMELRHSELIRLGPDLVICLHDDDLLPDLSHIKVLKLYWPDMDIPNMSVKDWYEILREITRYDKVLIMCLGGLGRTGTALAILGSLSGAISGDPIRWVRENYSPMAIETPSQERYIMAMTNISPI